MTTLNITDFNAFIKNQIHQHENLAEQLLQLCHVIGFTANTNLAEPNAVELHAQLIVADKLVKEAGELSQHLQDSLTSQGISSATLADSTIKR